MNYEIKRFRLRGITPLLGSSPMNKQIFSDYIATRAKTSSEWENAKADVDNIIDSNDKLTGFYRDEEGNIILKAYQIKGFLKESAKALKDTLGIASTTSKIDNYVFINERDIIVTRDGGEVIKAPDSYLERPLRGETAQGPRVSLAKSEMINEGWELEFTVKVIENKKTAKSVALDMSIIEELLQYGELKGLLQWRNGGYGSFTYEVLK